MAVKEDVLAKLSELQAAYTGVGSVSTLFEPVTAAVNSYFAPGDAALTHDIQYTINQLKITPADAGNTGLPIMSLYRFGDHPR